MVWYLVVLLASYQAYQTTEEAWNAYGGAKETYSDAKSAIGGLGLLAGGLILLFALRGRGGKA
jgi:hypothetical protein